MFPPFLTSTGNGGAWDIARMRFAQPGVELEPLDWIVDHAGTVRMLLEMIHLPDENTGEHFRNYLAARTLPPSDGRFGRVGTVSVVTPGQRCTMPGRVLGGCTFP
jgi:hypothetical protein